ncbi:MAG: carbamate kinase [Gemmatimonadota bacterium]|jgi:carbamate kinase|nr:carbamate kinase [Gemmatimonadota bacterium]MDP6462208.1 carbamate kinase [Gemmatimonadota bacterium]MDP6528210.1 carbamate kinase [Gemmatimonadota bacterium]MDP6803589.1 carbamate kinase [Gemmatimonadota bacterium]MDP7031852.1 carbamate kinase [Gemmatimonadota bacterium]
MELIALGGNAILPANGLGTIDAQMEVARRVMGDVAERIASGAGVILSHGNGPIVGNIVLRNEAVRDRIPPMPLDVCGADSQGGIGYMLQQVLQNELVRRGMKRPVASVVTQCVVDPDDPAFADPTKPIGPFYTGEEAAKQAVERGWDIVEDSGRGHRRVVPSPRPLEIVESEAILSLVEAGAVVIAAGGGGIPVVRRSDGSLEGVEAVIDKDRASAVLARQVGADRLVIVTSVPEVLLDFGKASARPLRTVTLSEAKAHHAEGQFPPGSMGPKMEAAVEFVESGGGEALITDPPGLLDAIAGKAGTRIVPDAEDAS